MVWWILSVTLASHCWKERETWPSSTSWLPPVGEGREDDGGKRSKWWERARKMCIITGIVAEGPELTGALENGRNGMFPLSGSAQVAGKMGLSDTLEGEHKQEGSS